MRKRISNNAPFTLGFSLVSLVMSAAGWIFEPFKLFFSAQTSSLLDPRLYLRLLTHVLMHDDLDHITGNFLLILTIGPLLEERYSGKVMFRLYVITALVTGITHLLLQPQYLLLGASGIAFMLIVLSTFTNLKEGAIPLTLILVVAVYLGNEVFTAIAYPDNGISQLAHITGGFLGAVFGYILNSRKSRAVEL